MPVSPLPDYIDQRRIGAATVTIIRDGSLLFPPRFAVPDAVWREALPEADHEGRLRFDLNVALIQLGSALVLIDPACDEPISRWQAAFAQRNAGVERSPGLAAALEQLGVQPEQITHVLITHAHGDHFGGVLVERDGELNVRFPLARHLIGRADWVDTAHGAGPGSDLAQRLGPVEHLGLLELVDTAREVATGIAMLHAPGETPGHCIVRLESAGECCYYLGDLVHHPAEVEHLDWVFPGRDPVAMHVSRAWVFAEACAAGAMVVSSHERFPPWGRIVRRDGGYRWEQA